MAWKFAPEEYRRLLKNLRNVGKGCEEITQVVAPRRRRNAAEGYWEEADKFMESGVHECARQIFRSFTLFPAI